MDHRLGMDVLEDRVCAHLSDLARAMASQKAIDIIKPIIEEKIAAESVPEEKRKDQERLDELIVDSANQPTIYADLQDELLSLSADKFQIIYNLEDDQTGILKLIEEAVNRNTNDCVKATEGEFEFFDDYPDPIPPDVASIITFDPSTCSDSRERYAALMVIQRFTSDLESLPAKKPGRLKPAGALTCYYGTLMTHSFDALAYWLNGALHEKHALPETLSQVDFSAWGERPPPNPFDRGPGF